jgi:hypothetical protein
MKNVENYFLVDYIVVKKYVMKIIALKEIKNVCLMLMNGKNVLAEKLI